MAKDNNIEFIDNSKRNNDSIYSSLLSNEIDFLLSVQHPWILPSKITELFEKSAFNFHNAKLPEYQGHNCCNHAILNSDKNYTVTLHYLEKGVDAGDIIYESTFDLSKNETAATLYKKANKEALRLFKKLIDSLVSGKDLPAIPQKLEDGVFYKRDSLDKFREVDPGLTSKEKSIIARALYFPPFEPAYEIVNGFKLYLVPSEKDSV